MRKYNIFIILMMFLMIYSPALLSINILHVVGAVSWLYLIINYKNVSKIINTNKLLILYMIFAFLWVYILLISNLNGNALTEGIHFLYWTIDIIPASIMITCYLTKKNYNIEDLLNIVLIVGGIQVLTALLAFIFPSVQQFFINQLISYGYSNVFNTLGSIRMYGMSSNLTYSTPIVQSVLGVVSIYLAINKNWKYGILVPFYLFSAIINARTTIVIFLVGLIAIFFSMRFSIKKFSKIFISSFIFVAMMKYIFLYIEKHALNTYLWILNGYEEFILFFKGETSETAYFSYVTDNQKYPIPDGVGFLFGVGQRIMGFNKYNMGSDIGYINDLWLGGIMYCIFIYGLFGYILFEMFKSNKYKFGLNKFIFSFFTLVLIVGNIKGYIISKNDFTTLIFIFFTYMVLKTKVISKQEKFSIKD